MDRFIREHNIGDFIDRLHIEEGPETRKTLQRLLVEEVDRFGRHSEQLDLLDRWIADGEARIAKLLGLVPARASAQAPLAERLLQNSNDVVALLKERRRQVKEQMDKSRL